MPSSEEGLLRDYLGPGYEYKENILMLNDQHNIQMSV
jgi:hypothetical protein